MTKKQTPEASLPELTLPPCLIAIANKTLSSMPSGNSEVCLCQDLASNYSCYF